MSELSTLGLARHSDAVEIARMSRYWVEEGLTWSWTPARVKHSISGTHSSVVVARRRDARRGDAQRIAAFAIMHFGEDTAHLNLLAVAPDYRRRGLARQLLDWLTATAVEAGVFRINLELRAQNEGARAFYKNMGFDEMGEINGYYQGRETALRMSRNLANNQC